MIKSREKLNWRKSTESKQMIDSREKLDSRKTMESRKMMESEELMMNDDGEVVGRGLVGGRRLVGGTLRDRHPSHPGPQNTWAYRSTLPYCGRVSGIVSCSRPPPIPSTQLIITPSVMCYSSPIWWCCLGHLVTSHISYNS